MNDPALHVTFSPSGGAVLKVALAKAGRTDEVISLMDSFSFGPINCSSLQERREGIEKDLHIYDDWGILEESKDFWSKALSDKRPKVLWTSRRSAMEYCGFLECLWRLGDAPCSVADLTDVKVTEYDREGNLRPPGLAICLGLISEDTVLRNGILDIAKPLSMKDRERYRALWKQLRAENAPFRVVSEQGITSAPITFFDEEVLSCVTNDWQKSARVIGEVMGKEWPFHYVQTGDLVYFSRLQSLVEAGRVESRGDMSKMRASEVRLPASAVKT